MESEHRAQLIFCILCRNHSMEELRLFFMSLHLKVGFNFVTSPNSYTEDILSDNDKSRELNLL